MRRSSYSTRRTAGHAVSPRCGYAWRRERPVSGDIPCRSESEHAIADHLLAETDGPVATVRLHRPEVLNALNQALMADLVDLLERLDADPTTRVVVLTGDERAFAAGADINEMADATAVEMLSAAATAPAGIGCAGCASR